MRGGCVALAPVTIIELSEAHALHVDMALADFGLGLQLPPWMLRWATAPEDSGDSSSLRPRLRS